MDERDYKAMNEELRIGEIKKTSCDCFIPIGKIECKDVFMPKFEYKTIEELNLKLGDYEDINKNKCILIWYPILND